MPELLSEGYTYRTKDGQEVTLQWDSVEGGIHITAMDATLFPSLVVMVKAMLQGLEPPAKPTDSTVVPASSLPTVGTRQTLVIPPSDLEQLKRLADDAQVAMDASNKDSRTDPKSPDFDPLAEWLDKPGRESTGTMSIKESRRKIRWDVGDTYKGGEKILQAREEETELNPHGVQWVLVLANGDTVSTDVFGKELQYCPAESIRAPEWMDPSGDLQTAEVQETPERPELPAVELPAEVAAARKVSQVYTWLREVVPDAVQSEDRAVAWFIGNRERLTCMRGLDEAGIRRRLGVLGVMA